MIADENSTVVDNNGKSGYTLEKRKCDRRRE